jgi:signal transduction histidine kinase
VVLGVADRDQAAWRAALGLAAFALALGAPMVAVAAGSGHLEHPVLAAALRAAWIGLYAAVGVWFARMRGQRRLGLTMTACAAISAVASMDALSGPVAYTVSRTAAIALPAAMTLMLISIPEARAVHARAWRPIVASVPVALTFATAYLLVAAEAPWGQAASACAGPCAGSAIQVADAPGLAHVLAAAAAITIIAALIMLAVELVRGTRRASPVAARTLRSVTWLTAAWAAPLAIGLVAVAIDPAPASLSPFLVTTGIIRAALPVAMIAVVAGRAARTAAIRDELTTRLSRVDDAATVQRVISEVLGDPSLQLAFRDGAGWIDVDGRPVPGGRPGGDRGWAPLDGDGRAALVFDAALEAQEGRMHAVAGLGAAALERARTEAELRATRRRLVAVAEQERKRIGRDLHDGAQQRLIGMALRVAIARETLAARPEEALPLLQEFGVDVQAALAELRDLAHGLYPPVLADHGLAEALRSLARASPVPVETEIARVPRADAMTEAAVYFCCSEALQNALKHAGPRPRIVLRLHAEGGALAFEVGDDGPGLGAGSAAAGTGLAGMRDRIEGVGGSLTIGPGPDGGTRVRGSVPLDGGSPDGMAGGLP